ncbi:MAG: hypothetical protein VYE64_10500, partial [Planctomycetota bacterium]|nr:hypothetical protein [Planctomycetota bacterium]
TSDFRNNPLDVNGCASSPNPARSRKPYNYCNARDDIGVWLPPHRSVNQHPCRCGHLEKATWVARAEAGPLSKVWFSIEI